MDKSLEGFHKGEDTQDSGPRDQCNANSRVGVRAATSSAKRRRLPQFNVQEMILKLRGPKKTEERDRLMSLKGNAAIKVLDSLQSASGMSILKSLIIVTDREALAVARRQFTS
jgi:hypothetical protein